MSARVLVADLQAPEAVEPGKGAFNHPAVATKSVLGLDAATGNARDDAPLAQGQAKVPVVVAFVGVQLVRSPARSTAGFGTDGLYGVDGGEHHPRVVDVGGAHEDRERYALGVDHKMALPALFASVCWVLARFLAPLGPVPRRSPRRPGPALRAALGASDARRLLCTSPCLRQHEQDLGQRRPVRHTGPPRPSVSALPAG